MADAKVTMKVYTPNGSAETAKAHAPRVPTLEGKTLCEVSNGKWEHDRIFPAVREQLLKRFPGVKIIPYNETVWPPNHIDDLEYVGKALKEKRCDAVISGMAA